MYFLHKSADNMMLLLLLQKHLGVAGPRNTRLRAQPFPSQSVEPAGLYGLASLP